jgi:osmotically-inducible protein OsmY
MTIGKDKLAEQITRALIEDERTEDSAIEVVNNNGVITLEGTATSNKARDAAEEIARRHDGVISVTSDLELHDPDTLDGKIPVIPAAAAGTAGTYNQ